MINVAQETAVWRPRVEDYAADQAVHVELTGEPYPQGTALVFPAKELGWDGMYFTGDDQPIEIVADLRNFVIFQRSSR